MRSPALVILCIGLIIFAGCGRTGMNMSGEDALGVLSEIPITSSQGTPSTLQQFDENTEASLENLSAMIQQLVKSGAVQPRGAARMAVSSNGKSVDLAALNQLIAVLQSQGGKPNAFTVAKGLMAVAATDGSTTGSKLESILALLQQLSPIIIAIAPQFAPIITAITTIVPIVIAVLKMFGKTAVLEFHWTSVVTA